MRFICDFCPDGTENHGIGSIKSTLSKTSLKDSSSFVLETKRMVWMEISGYERDMGLARNFF
jgi:hypothetical protein